MSRNDRSYSMPSSIKLFPVDLLANGLVDRKILFSRAVDLNAATSLIGPETITSFLEQGAHADKRIDLTINEQRIPSSLYTARDGTGRIVPATIDGFLKQGASLIINEVDDVVQKVADLAQEIEWITKSDVWVNCYVSYGVSGAFRAHYDSQDVIALQIKGAKRWLLFGEEPSDTPTPEATRESVLQPGDFVFVPRGIWHQAQVVDSPSVHLSISIASLTGLDLIKHSLRSLANDRVIRRPICRIASEEVVNDAISELKERLHDWVENLSPNQMFIESDENRRLSTRCSLWADGELNDSSTIRLALRRLLQPDQIFIKSDNTDLYRVKLGSDVYELGECALSILLLMSRRPEVTVATLVVSIKDESFEEQAIRRTLSELIALGLIYIVDQ